MSLYLARMQRLLIAMAPLCRSELVQLVHAIDPGYGYGFRIPTSGRSRDHLALIVARHIVLAVAYAPACRPLVEARLQALRDVPAL